MRAWIAGIALLACAFGREGVAAGGLPVQTGRILLPTRDPELAWRQVVDVIDDHFPIEHQDPLRHIDGGIHPGRLQTFALTTPPDPIDGLPHRRWASVSLIPATDGTWVDLAVYVDAQQPSADLASPNWRPMGHDVAGEQQMIGQLGGRFQNLPSPLPAPPNLKPRGDALLDGRPRMQQFFAEVRGDHQNYYSLRNLAKLTAAFGVGAALANTKADAEIQEAWQERIGMNQGVHGFKFLGEGAYMIPGMLAVAGVGKYFDNTPIGAVSGEWGERSVRAYLVGGPPLLLMQRVTGASRPDENPWGSSWRFWNDSNGVSGHAFVGSVPFITAAKMADRPLLKMSFYTLSVMPGLSRINDNAHYPSQVFLGWCMGYIAATAVCETESAERALNVVPLTAPGVTGLGIEYKR
jgi:hypothetical protein